MSGDAVLCELDALYEASKSGPDPDRCAYLFLSRWPELRAEVDRWRAEAEPPNADSVLAPEARVTAALRDAERADRALKEAQSEIARLRNAISALLDDGPS